MQEFTVEDLYLYRPITDLHAVSGSGLAVASVKRIHRADDDYKSQLWVLPQDGAPWELTSGNWFDSSPRLAPDGRQVAFLSDRGSAQQQVYLIDLRGGEAKRLTDCEHSIQSLSWSKDGERLLATAIVHVDSRDRGSEASEQAENDAPQVAWRLPFKRDGGDFLLNGEVHLFEIDAQDGACTRLTCGAIEARGPDESPDAQHIAFARTRTARDAHRSDLWIMQRDGRASRQATSEVSSVRNPRWSPDGAWIAFIASESDGDSVSYLWLHDVTTGESYRLSDQEVVGESEPLWLEDSKSLLIHAASQGRQEIWGLDIADGTATRIVGGERHVEKSALPRGRLVFSTVSIDRPSAAHSADRNGEREHQVTHFNPWWDERPLPVVQYRGFRVPDGSGGEEIVDGWLALPKDSEGPYPVLFAVHGGPHSYVLLDYNTQVHWMVLLSRGWAIVSANLAGSSSYGKEFSDRLRGAWGELDLPQSLAILKELEAQGIADQRVAIAGKSYGGYAAAWAVTQTDAFKAAIVSAPVANLQSHFGTSDSGYYVSQYAMRAEPYEDGERYRRLSPVQHMHKVTTPTLFLQGKDDQRCPLGQSEELFTSLMRATDVPTEMVLYPTASHHLAEAGKPSQRVDYFRRSVEWVERWVTGRTDSRHADEQPAAEPTAKADATAEPEPVQVEQT